MQEEESFRNCGEDGEDEDDDDDDETQSEDGAKTWAWGSARRSRVKKFEGEAQKWS